MCSAVASRAVRHARTRRGFMGIAQSASIYRRNRFTLQSSHNTEFPRDAFVRTWAVRQITGRTGLICLLWQVPANVEIDACLDRVADDPSSKARYARMLQGVGDLRREILQPIYTERLDERIRAG